MFILEKFFNFLDFFHQKRIFNFTENFKINIVFDVGSHKGEFLSYFIKNKKIRKFYAFEPQIIPFKILKKKFRNNKKVRIFNFALSDKNTNKVLNINKLTSTSSFEMIDKRNLYSKIKKILTFSEKYVDRKIKVKTRRLKSFLPNKSLDKIFIKIDVEGHEIYVLRGLGKKIKKIPYVMVENQVFNLYKKKNSVHKFLVRNNFHIIKKFTFPSLHTQDIIYKNLKC